MYCFVYLFIHVLQLNDETAQFDLLLKTKLGAKEQVFKAEVSRTGDGDWTVKHATIQ